MADAQIAKLSKELYKNQSELNPALFGDTDDDLFRPTLADDLKVGFFNLDRSCQTQQTDVVDLKEMTQVLQVLTKDTDIIKRDIGLTRKKLASDYENKLQEKTFDLYNRINSKLEELESMHHERVGLVRRAYRQQLADALARVETLFQARFEKQMEKDRIKHNEELNKLQNHIKSLTQTIQRNESVIVMLKQQLASKVKVEEKQARDMRRSRSLIPAPSLEVGQQCDLGLSLAQECELRNNLCHAMALADPSQVPPPREDTTKIDALTKEMEGLKEKLRAKDRELGAMEDELDNKNAELNQAADRIGRLQGEVEREQILKSQLETELADVIKQANASSSEAKKLKQAAADLLSNDDSLEQQRRDMELAGEEAARRAKEEALGAGAQKMREMQAEFAQKIGALVKEKEELQRELLRLRFEVDKSKKEITSETQFDPHAISSPPSQTSPQSACRPRPHRSRSAVASCKPSCKSIDGSVVSVAPNTSLYEPRSAEPQLESILKKNLKKRIKFSTSRLPVGIRKHGDLAIIDIPGNDGHIWSQAKNLATPPKKEEEPLTDHAKLAKSEAELRKMCEKYKKEIIRVNKAWERKFGILQASLHALKDESYLRQHLEKQHTTLHQATITYAAEPPRYIPLRSQQPALPGIPNRAPSPDPLASYTVSRASNRQALENQIASDDEEEMEPYGILQLPEQPRMATTGHAV